MTLLCGCSLKTNIIGKYASSKNPNCFEFKSDSTFLYEYREKAQYKFSTGTWSNNNQHTIIVNSKISNTIIPIKVDENKSINPQESIISIALNITGEMNLSNYKCNIFINDNFYIAKRCDSLSSIIVNLPIRDVYFLIERRPIVFTSTYLLFPLISESYKPKCNTCNLKIEASFRDSLFSYRSFNNERLKVKKGMIKIFNPITKRWIGLHKVVDSTKIFIHFK